jgi:hypothetical protein
MPVGGEKIVSLHAQVASLREDQTKLTKGLAVLRKLLRSMRWHDQGGYVGRVDGKWSFISTGLPQATPQDCDYLFALAGIEPDEIVPKGDCFHCKHAHDDGRNRGWSPPCSPCKSPYQSNFVPADRLTMLARFKRPIDAIRQRNREATVKKLQDPTEP